MLYSSTRTFKNALNRSAITFGTKTTKVFEKIKATLLLKPGVKPSDYIKTAYETYKEKCKTNNALNGSVFEMIFQCLFFQLDLFPLYSQVKLTYVPNIEFDFMLFKKVEFLDARGALLYNGIEPICISLKTTQRERYKQADLEAMALKNVHRNAKCYLIGLDDVSGIQNKIKQKDTFGLDYVYNAAANEFDDFISELRKDIGAYICPPDVPVCLSQATIK